MSGHCLLCAISSSGTSSYYITSKEQGKLPSVFSCYSFGAMLPNTTDDGDILWVVGGANPYGCVPQACSHVTALE
ncbi:hypothetical protein CBR_g28856 [Chara braunii]|uniref:Uncharacterized protein n=1 Tax=Chara braunii TaxID=69332 RepID=A0A388LA02_CHABU|nr:hypothetical protein CBR_g28856 [Chara braunii]|eukprot:GBG79141.1 hypothetical protein CBR_g28856 [Chara braunii]